MFSPDCILQWNVNSYKQRFQDLKILLQQSIPACVCLQETLIRNTANPPARYNIETPTPARQGGHERGEAILVHKRVAYTRVHLQTNLQATAVRVHLKRYYTICSLYLPHEPIRKADFVNLLRQLQPPFLLLGDMNAKSATWGERALDPYGHGRIIDELLIEENIALLNDSIPTHYSRQYNTTSLIDLSICSIDCLLDFNLEVMPDLQGSDHYPIKIQLNQPTVIADAPDRYNTEKADWGLYKAMTITHTTADSIPNIDDLVQNIEQHIVTAAAASMPMKSGVYAKPPVPWYNEEVANARRERLRALRAVKRNPSVANKIAYSRLKAKCRFVQLRAQRQSWQDYVSSINMQTSRHEIWKKVGKIAGKFTPTPTPVLRAADGSIVRDHREVADVLASTFAEVSEEDNYPVQFLQHKQSVERCQLKFADPNAENEPYNYPFSMEEFDSALRSTNKSSPGLDQITYSMIKSAHPTMQTLILSTFNRILIEQAFPVSWKTNVVVPIAKPRKDAYDPKNYRPITLSSCMCKLVEKMANVRLVWYLERNGHINALQCGFRKNKNTADALIQFEQDIQSAISRKHHTVAIFFDISKAYDTAWRRGVTQTLHQCGLRGQLPVFVQNFLTGRYIRVRVGRELSAAKELPEGIAQGSVLSCTCFMLAINKINSDLPPNISSTLYVDDFCMYSSGPMLRTIERRLQIALNVISRWCFTTGLSFNTDKTFSMHICKKYGCPRMAHGFVMNGLPIICVENHKFLGVTIDNKLNWNNHIIQLKKACLKSLNILKHLSHKQWGADRTSLMRLYMMLIRPKLDYGVEVYSSASPSLLEKLNPIHNAAIRIATGAFRSSPVLSLYAESGMKPPSTFRGIKVINTYLRILASPTNIMHEQALRITEQEQDNVMHNKGFLFRMHDLSTQIDTPIENIMTEVISPVPPWTITNISYCKDLFGIEKDKIPGTLFRRIYEEHKNIHRYTTNIYTDGSKTRDGVAFAFSHQQVNTRRIQAHASIFTAELYAIYYSLNYVQELPPSPVTICTDSKSAIFAISALNSPNPLVQRIRNRIAASNREVCFCWVPSHIGVQGNEQVDRAAREAITREEVEEVDIPRSDLKCYCRRAMTERWRLRWEALAGNKYREVTAGIRPLPNATSRSRTWEVTLARLRIGHCTLTHRFLMEGTPLPHCEDCIVPQTVVHFLTECLSYGDERRRHFGPGPYTVKDMLGAVFTVLHVPLHKFLIETNLYNFI